MNKAEHADALVIKPLERRWILAQRISVQKTDQNGCLADLFGLLNVVSGSRNDDFIRMLRRNIEDRR